MTEMLMIVLALVTLLFFAAKDFFSKALVAKMFFDVLATIVITISQKSTPEHGMLAVIIVFMGTGLLLTICASGLVDTRDPGRMGSKIEK